MGKHTKPGCLSTVIAVGFSAMIVAIACAGGGTAKQPEPRVGGQCQLDGQNVDVQSGKTHHTLVCRDGHWEPV